MKQTLALVLAVLIVGTLGCATVAPGEDKLLVHAQQTLAGATPLYDGVMKWYFANAATLSPSATAVFEKVRTGFSPAYKALDDAVDAYKAGKKSDLAGLEAALTQLILDGTNAVNVLKAPASKPSGLFLHVHPPSRLVAAWSF